MAVTLYDPYGRPIDRGALKTEQAAPTVTGIRQPYSGGHPAAGLTPGRLARLLREAIDGDAQRYLELAEDMEERDLHYAGVLGIRKRQVSGLEITVDAASDEPDDIRAADLVREVIERDPFTDELFDILDAVGKGFSATEIIWDTSEGQWRPSSLKWRDPRWFEFDRDDGETLRLKEMGGPVPLKPFGWITHYAKAKSGLPIRGGLARGVAWNFLFKSFTIKDWAVFCEAYGQPLRIGKYGPDASEEDKETLLRAIQNIGVDFGAIVPQSMMIELVEAKISGNLELYEKRADWLDRQTSKIVLGQTQTTDATAGGYATAKVHDGVRDDIEAADARQLSATLGRDLAKPLVDLNMGPRRSYPRIRIGRPEEIDVDKLVLNVSKLVPLGLKVGMSTMRDKLGLPDPDPDEELLAPAGQAASQDTEDPKPEEEPKPFKVGFTAQIAEKPDMSGQRPKAVAHRTQTAPVDAVDTALDEILGDEGWEPLVAPVVAGLEDKLAKAQTLDDVRAIITDHLATLDVDAFAETLARATFAARISGEADEDLA
ncbi:phage gp29-like protein [Breoghania corrubedonensis]|uniref:Phage gp29-like protein n=1 Tax=Breoghania corrubedonensis TaxID=665038 RepID=A0A2T5VCE7_9HYPH|nr:DUF935 domain-containing protein [Breoghania corrubedonensis]PTW61418.1 phage gp29-like protein [Breoghania corrubedonensis]